MRKSRKKEELKHRVGPAAVPLSDDRLLAVSGGDVSGVVRSVCFGDHMRRQSFVFSVFDGPQEVDCFLSEAAAVAAAKNYGLDATVYDSHSLYSRRLNGAYRK